MNSNIVLERNANILPAPGRLPFKPTGLRAIPRPETSPNLHLFSGSAGDIPVNLYAYAINNQQRNEAFERVAFAALAGSGIAGIVAAFI